MKKILALFLLTTTLFTSATLHAQIRKIPAEVTDAFKAKFPGATNVEWKDNLSSFQASFKLKEEEWTADFSSDGTWNESAKKMTFESLPAEVKEGFNKSKFSDWAPGSVTYIEKSDNSISYKIYAEKSSLVQKRFLYFNKQGQLEKDTPGI
jgi:hypothetical protein